MNTTGKHVPANLEGNLLRLGNGRQLAVYRRDGCGWVADIGAAETDTQTAGAWFATRRPTFAQRRAAFASVEPLAADAAARIERRHANATADSAALLPGARAWRAGVRMAALLLQTVFARRTHV